MSTPRPEDHEPSLAQQRPTLERVHYIVGLGRRAAPTGALEAFHAEKKLRLAWHAADWMSTR